MTGPSVEVTEKKQRPYWAIALATLGVLVLLAEITLHFLSVIRPLEYELNHGITVLGMILGFVGFYAISPTRAEKGIKILVDSAVAVIPILRRSKTGETTTAGVVVTTSDPKNPHAPPDSAEIRAAMESVAAEQRRIDQLPHSEQKG